MNTDTPPPPVVVVLAGGEGSRIGGGKPLKKLHGITMLARAIASATTWSDIVAVAVRSDGQLGTLPLQTILDDPEIPGPLGGLSAALRFAHSRSRETVLTIPCDAPFLPANLSHRLLLALGDNVSVSVASSGGVLHPVCALWRTATLEVLPTYVRSGRRSLRAFADEVGCTAVEWLTDPVDPFFNINTKQDLSRAEAFLRR